jgi:CHAD domain-containing protein
MAFELKQNEQIPNAVRRLVCKRIDKALETLDGKAHTLSDRSIHDARRRFKEIRGTLRLVRDELGEKTFRRENRTYRDAGRPLSMVRDAKVLLETLDGLIEHFQGRAHPENLERLRRILVEKRRLTRKQVLRRDGAVPRITKDLRAARKRVKDWPLQRRGWKAIRGGIERVYAQARQVMKRALAVASDENFHEWRKRAKDLRYELELLGPTWPEMIEPLAAQAHRLTDLLGNDHDLCVLRVVIAEDVAPDDAVDKELLFALIDERRATLQKQAVELGLKLYAEGAREFVRRLKGYWKVPSGVQEES